MLQNGGFSDHGALQKHVRGAHGLAVSIYSKQLVNMLLTR